jgi:hypothetical protein
MTENRLRLALEKLTPAHWERFERFASQFLAGEMPDLRTVASPSGDGGRDAELFSPVDDPTQVLQYSVTGHWPGKIRATAVRISETNPSAQILIYVTNQVIGAQADDLRKELRKDWHLHLDIRDRSYFLERYRRDSLTEAAAESLANDIVDPYLASEGILVGRPSVFETYEAKAAHVYLSLQLRDEVQEKGLTKLSFEALVRSALVRTDSEHRMKRNDVKAKVRQLLPGDSADRVNQLTDSALTRLTKRAIRYWPQYDEFCLTHDEAMRVAEYLAARELSESALGDEIRCVIKSLSPARGDAPPEIDSGALRLRRILERCLHERAEAFASAVMAGDTSGFATDHLHEVVLEDLRAHPAEKGNAEANPAWLESLVRELLAEPGDAIRLYLRDLADSYTVMAFLRQTPDVQSAIGKIFSHGEIWLDASAVLPMLAEDLLDDRMPQFQEIVRIATDAGLVFYVTSGVIEELDRHINRCLACCRGGLWEGRLPFLLEAFFQTGRAMGEFGEWAERFRGPNRPIDDIVEFLEERFGIRRQDLENAASGADQGFRHAVEEVWFQIHQDRRERAGNFDPIAIARLSKHDSESYVGVIQRRSQEKPSPFGYSAWWLTFDRAALRIGDLIKRDFGINPPDSPVLSLDFLAQYLTLGPLRPRVAKTSSRNLPVVIEPRLVRFLTRDLLAEATRIREEMRGLPERVTRRRIRDHLDAARRRMGPLSDKGADLFFEEIKAE